MNKPKRYSREMRKNARITRIFLGHASLKKRIRMRTTGRLFLILLLVLYLFHGALLESFGRGIKRHARTRYSKDLSLKGDRYRPKFSRQRSLWHGKLGSKWTMFFIYNRIKTFIWSRNGCVFLSLFLLTVPFVRDLASFSSLTSISAAYSAPSPYLIFSHGAFACLAHILHLASFQKTREKAFNLYVSLFLPTVAVALFYRSADARAGLFSRTSPRDNIVSTSNAVGLDGILHHPSPLPSISSNSGDTVTLSPVSKSSVSHNGRISDPESPSVDDSTNSDADSSEDVPIVVSPSPSLSLDPSTSPPFSPQPPTNVDVKPILRSTRPSRGYTRPAAGDVSPSKPSTTVPTATKPRPIITMTDSASKLWSMYKKQPMLPSVPVLADHAGLMGLCSLGNTCFMNAVLQAILHCPSFVNAILKNELFEELRKIHGAKVDTGSNLALVVAHLAKLLYPEKGVSQLPSSIAPHAVKTMLAVANSRYSGFRQHDGPEFLNFLFNSMANDLGFTPSLVLSTEPLVTAEEVIRAIPILYELQPWPTVQRIFSHFTFYERKCLSCEKSRFHWECCQMMSIPVPDGIEIEAPYIRADPQSTQVLFKKVKLKASVYDNDDLKARIARECGLEPHDTFGLYVRDGVILNRPFEAAFSHEDFSRSNHVVFYQRVHLQVDQQYLWIFFCDSKGKGTSFPRLLATAPIAFRNIEAFVRNTFSLKVSFSVSKLDIGYSLNHSYLDFKGLPCYMVQFNDKDVPEAYRPDHRALLPSPTKHIKRAEIPLQDCLAAHFGRSTKTSQPPNIMTDYQCTACDVRSCAQEFLYFHDNTGVSDSLIIHLKLFEYEQGIKKKVFVPVLFPELLDMQPYLHPNNKPTSSSSSLWTLYAVVIHVGDADGGHYITQAKAQDSWYEFNDAYVKAISLNAATPGALMLFYRRA